ncbi:transporter substrate-binding domain-containing protein [Streptomyces sp. NPDC047046]|uniref:transporter substrate-binding domain-containing protein n=1 Tax=Streptomyces sp. NPDC047046 TaxID=3155378 RepID=UPI0033F4C0E6
MTWARRGGRLRGWGGVAAMAVLCALASLALFCLPGRVGGTARATGAPDRVTAPDSAGTSGGASAGHALTAAAADDEKPCAKKYETRPPAEDGATIAAIKERGELVVGVDQNSYHWAYRGTYGSEPEGFDIDLARRVAKEILGDANKVRFKTISTADRGPALGRDEKDKGRPAAERDAGASVDMVIRTMSITCGHIDNGIAFSTPYFETRQSLVVPQDSLIKGFGPTLRGSKLCVAKGSTAESFLAAQSEYYALKPVTKVPSQLDCLVELQLGVVNGVVTDSALAASQLAQDPGVKIADGNEGDAAHLPRPEFYGIAMRDSAPDLVGRVDHVLADYRKDTGPRGWRKSYEKWLAADLGNASVSPPSADEKIAW